MRETVDRPADAIMDVNDLVGTTVRDIDGHRIGTVRHLTCDNDGRVVSFDVRERWMFGPHRDIPASQVTLRDGDLVVDDSMLRDADVDGDGVNDAAARDAEAPLAAPVAGAALPAPVVVSGRHGARQRYGGVDGVASLVGALALIGTTVIGTVAALAAGHKLNFDVSSVSSSAFTSTPLLVAFAIALVAGLLGGLAAGRAARYAGALNGVMAVAVTALLGALSWAAGQLFGSTWNLAEHLQIPHVSSLGSALMWGVVALVVAGVLTLLGAALGGALGEAWHRRVDRAMLDVADLGPRPTSASGIVGSPDATRRGVDDRVSVVED